jgi:hypothetical protein
VLGSGPHGTSSKRSGGGQGAGLTPGAMLGIENRSYQETVKVLRSAGRSKSGNVHIVNKRSVYGISPLLATTTLQCKSRNETSKLTAISDASSVDVPFVVPD